MQPGGIEQLVAEVERKYGEAQDRMSDPAVYNDHRKAADLGRQLKELEGPYKLAQQWRALRADLEDASNDGDLRELVPDLEQRIAQLEEELKLALVEKDIHTSTATVAVMPEAEDVEVDIDENDLKIDVYRSTGPGGQSVNTTDSAVRITHLPTGVVVAMQDEKSQLQNKVKAMRVLRARLYELERERQQADLAQQRRSQIGSGERAEKIRTYNFPENRVTDHRIKLTAHRLEQIVGGDLDEFTEALQSEATRRALE